METVADLRRAHGSDPGSCQFDCQGNAVETATYFTDCVTLASEIEIRFRGAGAISE
jgi:hypothetical protein